jgi:hypothetical protein
MSEGRSTCNRVPADDLQEQKHHLEEVHGILAAPPFDSSALWANEHEGDHERLDYPHSHQPETTCEGMAGPDASAT